VARHAALAMGGIAALRPPHSVVRLLYGHAIEAKDRARFRRTLRMLRNAFEFVSFSDAIKLLRDPRPPDGRYLSFSFDDGYRDNYELVAPLLSDAGASACFFVTTGFIECDEGYRIHFLRNVVRQPETRYPMTWAMVRELAEAGFEIGPHTVDHPNLAQIDVTEAEQQVVAAALDLERRLGSPCRWFAWPFGTAADFPSGLLPRLVKRFDGIFGAFRSRRQFSYGGQVINRDHFEPSWPTLHVRYFAFRAVSRHA
jgi:peptidoglycan/xylan/chitin deacetylase (PgdA/CDA1 family)